MARPVSYRDAGVDIDAGEALVDEIRKINPSIGGFGGLVPVPAGLREPQLVLSTDGVGTKLLVAQELDVYNTIGVDLVAMVVNDILAAGASPIAFLDYYAVEKLSADEATEIVQGIANGCKQAGCELTGGETAELPGVYPKGGFDLAGFGVGIVEKNHVIDGSKIRPGDVVLGLPSSGLHSNGYSLARKVLLKGRGQLRGKERTAALERLLVPTSIYVQPVLRLLKKIRVRGIAHITGGGLPGNLVRVLPEGTEAVLYPDRWERPAIFDTIAAHGPVEPAEMYKVFNMGIGLCLVLAKKDVAEAIRTLRRSMVHAVEIGTIRKGCNRVLIDGVCLNGLE